MRMEKTCIYAHAYVNIAYQEQIAAVLHCRLNLRTWTYRKSFRIHVCVFVHVSIDLNKQLSRCMCVRMYTYMCLCVSACKCMFMCMDVWICVCGVHDQHVKAQCSSTILTRSCLRDLPRDLLDLAVSGLLERLLRPKQCVEACC